MGKRMVGILFYLGTILGVLAASLGLNRAVTALAEGEPGAQKCCIVIDPGHGGEDGGAVSCTGKPESSLNLEISLRLRDVFHLLGCQTRMIRTDDTAVYREGETIAQKKVSDLKQRVRFVEETPGAILVSIHQNTFPDGQYSGAQVFYGKSEGSRPLAEALQTALVTHLNPGSRRKTKKGEGIYLLEHISRPGVLVECGFLSNRQEEAKLRSQTYQKWLACIIAVTTVSST